MSGGCVGPILRTGEVMFKQDGMIKFSLSPSLVGEDAELWMAKALLMGAKMERLPLMPLSSSCPPRYVVVNERRVATYYPAAEHGLAHVFRHCTDETQDPLQGHPLQLPPPP